LAIISWTRLNIFCHYKKRVVLTDEYNVTVNSEEYDMIYVC